MADDEKQTAAKQRIITHVNADHQETLALFLEVYCRVGSSTAAEPAQMEDISLSDMVINAGGTRYSVPIDPPMKSLLDARHRFVEMRNHCLKTLGVSDITVKEYWAPRGFHAVIFALCFSTYVAFPRRANFLPGSTLYSLALKDVPRFAKFCYDIQPILLPLMVGIHVFEAGYLAITRLRPHRVPVLSGLWLTWMTSCFIEGFGAFQRFDAIVRKERVKKEQHKPTL